MCQRGKNSRKSEYDTPQYFHQPNFDVNNKTNGSQVLQIQQIDTANIFISFFFAFKPFPVSWIHVANSEAQQFELNQACNSYNINLQ